MPVMVAGAVKKDLTDLVVWMMSLGKHVIEYNITYDHVMNILELDLGEDTYIERLVFQTAPGFACLAFSDLAMSGKLENRSTWSSPSL